MCFWANGTRPADLGMQSSRAPYEKLEDPFVAEHDVDRVAVQDQSSLCLDSGSSKGVGTLMSIGLAVRALLQSLVTRRAWSIEPDLLQSRDL